VDIFAAALLVFGGGFLVANARVVVEYLTYLRRRRTALLTWRGPLPKYYLMSLTIGVVCGILVMVKLYVLTQRNGFTLLQAWRQAFGETMMFMYFAYLVPLRQRIGRGFYEDGIWADSSFIPYNEVGGISWRATERSVSLILISRLRNLARRLAVPLEHYGAARRLLRDKIGEHEIHFSGTGLDLGAHDERDEA
jgi:hypothetical protein